MNSLRGLSIRVDVPVPPREGKAHGIPPDASRLVVAAETEEGEQLQDALLTRMLPRANVLAVVVIGPFESIEKIENRLEATAAVTLKGLLLLEVANGPSLGGRIRRVDAEEVALFDVVGREMISRLLTEADSKFWQQEGSTVRGVLASALDAVDPIVFFAKSHNSIETIGSRTTIRRCTELAWGLFETS